MRNLDECRAEIFARSEKRIAKRRKIRRRIIVSLTPLCLCVVLFVMLPIMRGPDKSVPMENAECAGESAYGAVETERKEATVISEDGEEWTLSAERTSQLIELLDDYLVGGTPVGNNDRKDYAIVISTADGNEILYILNGRQLTCDGVTVELTEFDLQKIMNLLRP